jgi:hypothetical protein
MSRSARFAAAKLWGILFLEIYLAHVMVAAVVRIGLQKVFGLSEPLAYLWSVLSLAFMHRYFLRIFCR